ncbi:MAG: Ig-like domain-containing protein [Alphaproteobacteria bacterium]
MATSSSRLNRALWDLDASSASGSDPSLPLVRLDAPGRDLSLNGRPPTLALVAIDAVAVRGETETLLADLEALGLRDGAMAGRMVSGLLPVSALDALEQMDSLAFANPAIAVTASQGIAENQGDRSVNADIARSQFGVDGTGVRVGALSDSFDALNGADEDIATGDLPPEGVQVVQDFFANDPSDEGRAMLQIIHDVAPGADLSFATAFGGQATFARNIERLADRGADVIVDDVAYLAEPFFQDGIISQAVDTVAADGVAYFSSAGNQGRSSYEANFRPTGITLPTAFEPGAIAHDWDPGPGVDTILDFTLQPDESVFLSLQWDQPFGSLSNISPGASTDVDIYLVDGETGLRVRDSDGDFAAGINPNIGLDPVEIFRFENEGNTARELGLVIEHARGPEPDFLKIVFFDSANFINEKQPEFTGEFSNPTVVGHSAAAGAISVGAAFYQNTPRFGVNPPRLNSFSSQGPTSILFDIDGNRLAQPEIRQTPDIVAPDGVDTTFFGSSDFDNTGFNDFFGTSAAAPQAAAVAALMLDANPDLTPEAVRDILQDTAINIGFPGFDNASGAGLIQADRAVQAALASSTAPLEARDDAFTGDEDSLLTGDLFADNGAGPDGSLAAGQPIVSRVNGVALEDEALLTLASGAVVTIRADGSLSYDPRGRLDGLAEDETIQETVTYRIAAPDGTRESAPATVRFMIEGINDAPRPVEDVFSVAALDTLAANLFADNGNGPDTDPEGSPLILTALAGQPLTGGTLTATLASGAVVIAQADGSIAYDPAAVDRSLVAEDSFSYTVSDGVLSATGLVRVALPAQDDPGPTDLPPDARADAFTTPEDTVLSGDVLADNGFGPDTDPEGEALSVALETGPSFGLLTLQPDGTFLYEPGANFNGTDSFTYALTDPARNADQATATITVTPVNDAPTARDDLFTTGEDEVVSGAVLADNGTGIDLDLDGDALTVTAVNGEALTGSGATMLPSGAILEIGADGSFVYDPNGAFADLTTGETAVDTLSYTIADPSGATASASVNITVTGKDTAIAFGPGTGVIAEGTGASVTAGFTLERTGALDSTVTVRFEGQGEGTNPADGTDFVSGAFPSGQVTFAPGVEAQTVTFAVAGDSMAEPDETFAIVLTDINVDRGAIDLPGLDRFGFVISDDDAAPEPTILGTPGVDILFGTADDDVIDGLGGNDALFGEDGDDLLLGGAGNDILFAANGQDTLHGGEGNDFLFGGAGEDIFVIRPGDGSDRIRGFETVDRIDLQAFTALTGPAVLNRLNQAGRNVRLELDFNTDVIIENTDVDEIGLDQFILAQV